MDIRQLRYFVTLSATSSFTETARQCCISQSALSQQIKSLEEELGIRLFDRSHHSVKLTSDGMQILTKAKRVLYDMEDCLTTISAVKGGKIGGELNIGLTYSLEPYVRPVLIEFLQAHPAVKVNAHYKNLPELLRKLGNGEIDIMISMMPTSTHDFCRSVPIMRYRLGAVMRQGHPLAKKKAVTFSDLQKYELILPERGIRDRNAIESYIHKPTGDLNIRSLVNDANAILNILEHTDYISILATNTTKTRPKLQVSVIDELRDAIQIYCHTNTEMTRKQSAELFIKALAESFAVQLSKFDDGDQ